MGYERQAARACAGGLLLLCAPVPVDYLDIPGTLKAQREHVLALIASHSQAAQPHPALDFSDSGPTGGDRQFYLHNPGAIMGVVEAGWPDKSVAALLAANLRPSAEVLRAELLGLIDELLVHDDSWPFREKVDPKLVPDYYVAIKHPIGAYRTPRCAMWWAGGTLALALVHPALLAAQTSRKSSSAC